MFKKTIRILRESLPIVMMISCIPFVKDDYILLGLYCIIISISAILSYKKSEGTIFLAGFFFMLISESIFISTGVEVFLRKSLFGIMPIWLPVLWAYGFVAIGRAVKILESK